MLGLAAQPAAAAPGDLDTTFDSDGIVTENIGTRTAAVRINAIARQADGKIVAGGQTTGVVDPQFVIARYNADGSLDTSFGTDGVVILTVGKYHSFVNDVAIQADGKIVAVGWAYRDFGVVRLNSDGSLDAGFGGDGIVTTDFNSNVDLANAVTIDGSGKIVVGGSARSASNNDDFGLARYNTDGTLDTTFSGDGLTTTPFPAGFGDEIFALAIDAADKIVAAGDGSGDFGLARYNTDGTLDTSFDTDGLATTDFGGADEADDLAIAGTGEITAVGKGDGDLALARYTSAGALDTSLDTDGMLTTAQEDLNDATGVVLSGGKTVVSATNSGTEDFALARFNADGSLDTDSDADPGTSLGGDGIVKTDINGGDDFAYDLLEEPGGKLVLGGRAATGGTDRFAVARFNDDGSLDNSFDANGIRTDPFDAGSDEQLFAVAEDPEGKLVAAGEISFGGALDFLVMRFNTDGSLDNTFDGDGIQTTDLGAADAVRAVAVQPDGKILVGGSSGGITGKDFAIVRYNTDGSLDTDSDADPGTDWGLTGVVTEDLGGTADRVNALAIQANGKVVAAGIGDGGFGLARFDEFGDLDDSFDGESSGNGSFTTDFGASNTQANDVAIAGGKIIAAGQSGALTDFAIARYNVADGGLDGTFDGDGKATTDFGGLPDAIEGIAVQGDGKIVAGGWTNSGSSSGGLDFALARYLTNGSLDTGFDSDGKVVTPFVGDNDEQAFGVALQADGKIVAGGLAKESSAIHPRSFALARYGTDGMLDTAFDGDGKVTTDLGASAAAFDTVLTSATKIVLAGAVFNGPEDAALARYDSGGTAAPTRTLDVTLTGAGSGTVTGPGISCPGDCTQDYASGAAVSLNATPGAGSSFEGWGGDCTGGGSCNLTMNGDRDVSAQFSDEPEPPEPPEPPESDDPTFDMTLDSTPKGVIKATLISAREGRFKGKAKLLGGKKRYRSRSIDARPHRTVTLKLRPTRKVKKKLRRTKKDQKVKVSVIFNPEGDSREKRSEKIKADLGREKRIAKWVDVAMQPEFDWVERDFGGGLTRAVWSGELRSAKVTELVPANSRVPAVLKEKAEASCSSLSYSLTVYLNRTGAAQLIIAQSGLITNGNSFQFNGITNPDRVDNAESVIMAVRYGTNTRTKFKGKQVKVFCSGFYSSEPVR